MELLSHITRQLQSRPKIPVPVCSLLELLRNNTTPIVQVY